MSPAPAGQPRTPAVLRRPWLLERAALVVVALIIIVSAMQGRARLVAGEPPPTVLAGWLPGLYIALAVSAAGVVLAWRHRWLGLVLIAAAPLISTLLQWDPIASWNIGVFAAFWMTLRGLPGLPTGLLVGAANFTGVALATEGFSLQKPIASIAAIAALTAAATGSAVRGHYRYWAELERRTRQAEATREAEALQRVAQERVRIARDLHDVVGHEVALVSMQLGAVEVHLPDGADAARTDLGAARAGLQSVLAGMQQILRVLRTGPDGDSTAPVAGYEHVGELVAAAQAVGLEVEATIGAPTAPLTAAVSAAAYRIVQEALTNAQRHGTGAVSLKVAADDEAVTVETVNVRAAPSGHPRRSGYGLVGMRERAASVGGWIDTQADDTLFWLWAHLPINRGDNR